MNEQTNRDLEGEFFEAVKMGKLDVVRQLVGEKKDLLFAHDGDEFGGPCLNLAAGHRRNFEMVKLLVELGADVNQKSDWWAGSWTAGMIAQHYDMKIAEYLVENGAELNIHLAAAMGRIDRVKELLDAEPDLIHARGGDGCMPIHFSGSKEMVDLLLERGAGLESRDIDHHSTPVQWLAENRAEIARYLFERGAKADIFSAILAGDMEVVGKLIGDDPDVLNWKINQEFYQPGEQEEVENIMTFTIGRDATPLHAAAKTNQLELIKLLVEKGADVNVRGAYDDCTALHLAAWDDRIEAAELLIELGADIERQSGEMHQNTPLGWAIVAGSVGVAELLIKRGAEIRDYYLKDAKAGIEGEFNWLKSVPKENYEKIVGMLK